MLQNLSAGLKVSITRSIQTSFDQYMRQIDWDVEAFTYEGFALVWQDYIHNSATWYKQLEDEVKNDQSFHQELAVKIQETIEKILSEEPTKVQVEQLKKLQKDGVIDSVTDLCKLEAKYYIEKNK